MFMLPLITLMSCLPLIMCDFVLPIINFSFHLTSLGYHQSVLATTDYVLIINDRI